MTGVSPYVEKNSGTIDRIWRSDGPAAQGEPISKVSDCDQIGKCSPVKLKSTFGNDITIVTLKDGSRFAYFVDMRPDRKKIKTALMGSDNISQLSATLLRQRQTDQEDNRSKPTCPKGYRKK
jgi:hypothetical protein